MTVSCRCCVGAIILCAASAAATPTPDTTSGYWDELTTIESDIGSTTDEYSSTATWTETVTGLDLYGRDNEEDDDGSGDDKPLARCDWPAMFLCYTGECIDAAGLCNGIMDCILGEDEGPECGESTTIVFALVSMSIGTIFAMLFMYMYYLRIKMLEEDVFVTPGGDSVSDADRRYIRLVEIALRNTAAEEMGESVEFLPADFLDEESLNEV